MFCQDRERCRARLTCMRTRPWLVVGSSAFGILAVVGACSRSNPGPSAPTPSASASSSAPEPELQPVVLVAASAVVTDCPDAKWMQTRVAQRAIQKLVDPCIAVPGGKAHFSARLRPGGRIELASPSGDPDEGVVPTCVLKELQTLRHHVYLKHACVFDVTLEERPEPPRPE